MNNIILIGMPGSGKSTLGVVLAKKLGYKFIDSDLVIQEKYEKTLERIIEEHGDAGFIAIENEVNCSINAEHAVIATGGSAVYGAEAMKHFKSIGKIIYLEVSKEEIEDRLGSLKERGVVSNGKQTIREIYEDRRMLYKKYADITVSMDQKRIRESVEELYDLVVNKDNNY
jgi:shikimate kinase